MAVNDRHDIRFRDLDRRDVGDGRENYDVQLAVLVVLFASAGTWIYVQDCLS